MHQLRNQVGGILPLSGVDFVLRLVLASLLFYASADKIIHPADFAAIVKDYHILPEALVNPVAIWLPWFELALGLCLFTGWLAEGAAVSTAALFAAFWSMLIFNYFRGINVACGCFSTSPEEARPMLFYIGRDAVLLALAILTAWVRLRVAGASESQPFGPR